MEEGEWNYGIQGIMQLTRELGEFLRYMYIISGIAQIVVLPSTCIY
jgi:hypothetical protein